MNIGRLYRNAAQRSLSRGLKKDWADPLLSAMGQQWAGVHLKMILRGPFIMTVSVPP